MLGFFCKGPRSPCTPPQRSQFQAFLLYWFLPGVWEDRGRRGQLPPSLPFCRDPNAVQDAAVLPYSPLGGEDQKKNLRTGKSQLSSASGPAAIERVWIRAMWGCQEAIPSPPTPPSPCSGLSGGSVPVPVPPELRQAPSASPGGRFPGGSPWKGSGVAAMRRGGRKEPGASCPTRGRDSAPGRAQPGTARCVGTGVSPGGSDLGLKG